MAGNIAILTRYYNSENYGGVLQAYALNRYIRELGYPCETLQYDSAQNAGYSRRVSGKNGLTARKIIGYAYLKGRSILRRPIEKRVKARLRARSAAFAAFRRDMIPHSDSVYHAGNIGESNELYDAFVVGSDRVWMPNGFRIPAETPYFLDFVKAGNKKIAYAASMGRHSLQGDESAFYQQFLNSFDAVGLREKAALDLLDPLIDDDRPGAEWVTDPVCLLDQAGWETLLPPAQNRPPYAFVYLLSNTRRYKDLITRFSKARNLRLVTLPFAGGAFNPHDLRFGDEMAYDCGPREFVGLLRGADLVMTDSFHCAAFSLIFEKEFLVFDRDQATGKKSYLSRLISLMDMAGIPRERIIGQEMSLEEMMNLTPIPYSQIKTWMDGHILRSKRFLADALSDLPKPAGLNEI